MLQSIRNIIKNTPVGIGNYVKYGCLVGLRCHELVESVHLIQNPDTLKDYYNPQTMTLSHYKYKDIFIRRTKKSIISLASPSTIEIAKSCEPGISYNGIRLRLMRKKVLCDLRFCRKIHATHLYQSGIPPPMIDALQSRLPTSNQIFARHYYKPSPEHRKKILESIEELRKQIESY
jgi:intergrase/recombinase